MDATGATITGAASAVSFAGPVPMVTVDGIDIPLDLISGITAAKAP
jgi:flagellar basal-body rod modification protein FlgD